MYGPTHYYVRVSQAAIFTGTGPSSQVPALLHIAKRGPSIAPPTTFEPTGNQDDTRGERGRQRRPQRPWVLCRGRLFSTSPAEGLPPGGTLLRATRQGIWLPASLLLPPESSWQEEVAELGPPAAVVT